LYIRAGHSFEFDHLLEIQSRQEFTEFLPTLSQSSKRYFALSSQYFDTQGNGDVQLVGALKSFSNPEILSGLELSIMNPEFSFTCWIKTTPQFVSGYLVRKRPAASGAASHLSCWSWFLGRIPFSFLSTSPA